MIILLCVLGGLSLIGFLAVRTTKSSPLAVILKTVTSLIFCLVAIVSMINNFRYETALFFSYIIVGLLFGTIGDILLDLKMTYIRHDSIYTFAGMTSFALGHIFYLIALISYFGFSIWALVITAVMCATMMLVTKYIMKYAYGKFIIPATIYCFLLIFMMVQACASGILNEFTTTTILLFVGGIFFVISDAILSLTYFGGKESRVLVIFNHITYYAAQFLIALSILYI